MNYRSRGTLPMPITLRVPSFGGIRAPEHHGESLEALFAHVPGLKVVSPSNPHEAYHLLKYAATRPDPVIFMEPKSRYWQKGEVDRSTTQTAAPPPAPRSMREGRHLTLVAWGAMVARCLQVAGARRRGRDRHRGPGPALAQADRRRGPGRLRAQDAPRRRRP